MEKLSHIDITGDTCPAHYVAHPTNGFCYRAFASSSKTFQNAENECNDLVKGRAGSLGHLARVTNVELHDWIMQYVITPSNTNL